MLFSVSHRSTMLLLIASLTISCSHNEKWEGQEAIQKVSTFTVPIQKQQAATKALGNGIYSSNDFAGARLNEIALTNDTVITVVITPENTPINESPWYSFKLWSEVEQNILLQLTYSKGVKHRYYPKISFDGSKWKNLDSANYMADVALDSMDKEVLPDLVSIKLTLGPDTLWLSAQELITAQHVKSWTTDLERHSFVSSSKIGESLEGRAINLLKIGKSDDQKMIVVLSRQHPPEVTGYLAMTSFIETICSNTETAKRFRADYNTYVIPLANPDGVHLGHWRHSAAGIDLNRDWQDFNQPETVAIKEFMENKVAATGGKFYFGVDFHSTYEDIYYTIDPQLKGNMPGLIPNMIKATGQEINGYEPNIRPRPIDEPPVTSLGYFFYGFGAESLTYEIGDNTPRTLLKKKGEVSAMKLMELMNDK